jgi:carboxyl-terminal processing protease
MKLNLKQTRRVFLIFSLVVISGLSGFWAGRQRIAVEFRDSQPTVKVERAVPPGKENIDFSLFWTVWDRLNGSYLEKKSLDPRQMVYGAISGMVSALGDPYTVFLPPTENKEAKEDLSGAFEGVGIQLGYKDSKLAVIAPLTGSPAEKAGVKAGDLILKITDEKKGADKETAGMSLPEAVTLIRGPKGTVVKLELSREGGEKPFTLSLTRETIVVKSVEVTFLESSKPGMVAHLKLLRFGERTNQEWQEAVEKIQKFKNSNAQNFKGVVLDLRNNPGGFLGGAVDIASEFLPEGIVVWQDKGNDGKESFSVNRKGQLTDVPLVVLVNNGSASASEIVAGALREKERARLVGEKTFGKGTIQEAQELSGGAGLHITIARWLLPSGKSIDKEGLKPDFEVKPDEKDLPAEASAKEGPAKDSQLEKAIEVLTNL